MNKNQILIVEDEILNAMLIKKKLENTGKYDCRIIASGEEAVDNIRALMPDLIIMDIYLKGEMDGIDAVEMIHKEKNIPIIYVTASSDQYTFKRANNTEMFRLIKKPFTDELLIQTVDEALSGK